MSVRAAFTWDLRILARSRMLQFTVLALLVLAGAGAFNGWQAAEQWSRQSTAALEIANDDLRKQLEAIRTGSDPWAALPFSAKATIVLPPAPLAALSTGRSDMDPRVAQVSAFTQAQNLFRNYEIESPLALALGRFDFGFVVQFLLPLFVVVLGYGLFAEERERGLDKFLVMQGISLRQLLVGRLLARSLVTVGPVLLVLVFVAIAGGVVRGSDNHGLRFAWYVAFVCAYALFWWTLVGWVCTWRLRQGPALLSLVAAWVALVLVLPALAGLSARHFHPAPSRFELVAASRSAEIEATLRGEALVGQYAHDHPDLDAAANASMPAWARTVFLVSRTVDDAVAPVGREFDESLAKQQRVVQRWQFVSPALVVQRSLIAAAGTDEARAAQFKTQARDFMRVYREQTGAMIMAGRTLDADSMGSLPVFTFRPDQGVSLSQRLLAPLAWLLLVGGLMLLVAVRRARI